MSPAAARRQRPMQWRGRAAAAESRATRSRSRAPRESRRRVSGYLVRASKAVHAGRRAGT